MTGGSLQTAGTVDRVADSIDRIGAVDLPGAWIALLPRDVVLARAAAVDPALPLAGRTLAVKGNIAVAGLRTTAGCPTYGEVAERSATVVRRLEAAGATVVGQTDLDQFATGLSGTRSPRGSCRNPGWPELISGGSSSGSAVTVAAGVVDLALGTDTAGSGRVPAAANGIIGLKPTRGRIGMGGVVPACRSLDCVSIFSRDLDLAALALRCAEGDDPDDPWTRTAPAAAGAVRRLGVPSGLGLEDVVPEGVDGVEVDLSPFLAAGDLLYGGAFVAERYAAVGPFVETHPDDVDPSVRSIILASRDVPAWRLADDRTELERLRRLTQPVWDAVDAIVVPSLPRIPTLAEVLADPIAANVPLGTYTNFVNLLDLAALTIPIGPGTTDAPPRSVTLIGPAWSDDRLVEAAQAVLAR